LLFNYNDLVEISVSRQTDGRLAMGQASHGHYQLQGISDGRIREYLSQSHSELQQVVLSAHIVLHSFAAAERKLMAVIRRVIHFFERIQTS
jgi:hypothetical protein